MVDRYMYYQEQGPGAGTEDSPAPYDTEETPAPYDTEDTAPSHVPDPSKQSVRPHETVRQASISQSVRPQGQYPLTSGYWSQGMSN